MTDLKSKLSEIANGFELNEQGRRVYKGDIDLSDYKFAKDLDGVIPCNAFIDGDLNLSGTMIKELPDGLAVTGDVKLFGARLKTLPNRLEVLGDIDIRLTKIKRLPTDLIVHGEMLFLADEIEGYPMVQYCGFKSRTIYLCTFDKSLIRIGCFLGTKDEAIELINKYYDGKDAARYIAKVKKCFNKWDFKRNRMKRTSFIKSVVKRIMWL